jgi:quercetin dioxygenase-like cupin family protein
MRVVDFSPDRARTIAEFGSRGATSVRCGDGAGEAHIHCLRFEPGGMIGPHPAGFGQLLLVVSGSGWAAGEDGERIELREGQAAHFALGEVHSKGSEAGMTAIMVQVRDLTPAEPSS